MNMQQMVMQAQKMQRELNKALEALYQKEFKVSKGGCVTVTMLGDKTVKSIDVEKDAFNPDDKEMVEDTIMMAINELIEKISEEESEINERITGRSGGLF